MSVHFLRAGCAALILTFSSQSALADLSAKDVWANWQSYFSAMGYEITGTQAMSGDTLKISDIGTTITVPEEGVVMTFVMTEMSLTENSNGTVSISIPPSQLLTFGVTVENEDDVEVGIDYSQTGMSMIVSGDANDMTYTFSADNVTVALASIEVDGEKMPADIASASISMNAMSGSSNLKVADLRSYSENVTIGDLSFAILAQNPDGDDMFEMSGKSENLVAESSFVSPLTMESTAMRAMLDSGMSVTAKFTFGAGNYSMKGVGDGDNVSADGSSQGGAFQVTMDKSNLLYDFSVNDASTAIITNELPFPVSFAVAKYGLRLSAPLGTTTELQDFAAALTLQDFTMADMLWSIFDPTGALPRDPATILIDLKGKARVLVDMFDPNIEEIMMAATAPPAELHALTLNNLLVSAAGAELSGTGDMAFDNNDLQTYGGMPAPSGTISLKLVGVNGLMDKLVAMGLIGDQEVMGARMGMGMLAVAGDGEDTLISNIEMTADGKILANGQRIK